jgi:F-type H+-transporting ATPase subunit a
MSWTIAFTQLAVAATDEPDPGVPFHLPSIAEFFPPAIFGAGTPYEFNRVMLVRVIMAVVIIWLLLKAVRRLNIVPGRAQNVWELLYDFIRVQIAEDTLGVERGRKHLPWLVTLFISITLFNFAGEIPGLNMPATARVGLPFLFAVGTYAAYFVGGIQAHGVGGFLKNSLFPPGVPPPLYIIITPVEALQVFVTRPLTLMIRLTANMIAGHLLLVLAFSATHFLVFEAGGLVKIAGGLTYLGGLALTLFEMFVAALQAYIFPLLSAVYINMTESSDH